MLVSDSKQKRVWWWLNTCYSSLGWKFKYFIFRWFCFWVFVFRYFIFYLICVMIIVIFILIVSRLCSYFFSFQPLLSLSRNNFDKKISLLKVHTFSYMMTTHKNDYIVLWFIETWIIHWMNISFVICFSLLKCDMLD